MCKIFICVDVTDLGKTHLPATFETKRGVLQVLPFWDICLSLSELLYADLTRILVALVRGPRMDGPGEGNSCWIVFLSVEETKLCECKATWLFSAYAIK